MRYTLLGKTGLRVSEIALGTMGFGAPAWGTSEEVSAEILDRYLEAGGNFIDTADQYSHGSAEFILGAMLDGRRDDVVLATKYSLHTGSGGINAAGNHRKNLVSSLEASLRRLRTDYIDLLWVHARDTRTPVEEVMRALDDQVRAGKVLYVGVSDWPAWEVAQANTLAELRGWSAFAGMQIHYNLIERTAERELLPMARVFDIGVAAWGPLGQGLLTGKYLDGGGTGRRAIVGGGPTPAGERADRIVREVVTVAKESGNAPAQVALAWVLSRPGLVAAVSGATRPDQVDNSLGSLDVALDADALARLNEVSRIDGGFPHDFLRTERSRNYVYGPLDGQVEDRRATVNRAVADDIFA